jgi:hypothetical protein
LSITVSESEPDSKKTPQENKEEAEKNLI